jgi:hypothetical protein
MSEDARFCPNCGNDSKATGQKTSRERPTGITILAVLQSFAGLGTLLLGILLVLVGGLLGTVDLPAEVPSFFTGAFAAAIGLVLIFIGIISFVVAYGFWNGRGWGWTIGIVVNVIGAITDLASLPSSILGLFLSGIILYYLTRPHVKRYFGK